MFASRVLRGARIPVARCFSGKSGTGSQAPTTSTPEAITTNHPDGKTHKVVLFPGHGIGPEITAAVLKIFDELKRRLAFNDSSNKVGRTSCSRKGYKQRR